MKISIKRTFLTISIVISILIGNISCAPLYVPNAVNVPVFSEKGEIQGVAYYGTSGFDAQLAFAASDNIGLMINGSSGKSEYSKEFHKHSFIEFGIGGYKKIKKDRVFEIYGGAGFGSSQTNVETNAWKPNINVNNQRLFLQPSVGFTTDFMDGSIAMRIVHVRLNQNSITESSVFFEPAITTKGGYKNLKAIGQIGISLPNNKKEVEFERQSFWMSVGLHYELNLK